MQNEPRSSEGAGGKSGRSQRVVFSQSFAKVSRWVARGISLVVLAIWGFFIIVHLIGGPTGGGEEASQPLRPDDYVGLFAMGGWLIGLMLGWRWEPVGGTIVIVAYVISAVVNPNVLSFPFLLIPTAGLLFLVSSRIRQMNSAG